MPSDHCEVFNGDSFILREFARILREHAIHTVVETGTFFGQTTAALAASGVEVHTIEIIPELFLRADHLDRFPNVWRYFGSSPEVLDRILPSVAPPTLFFLDAHWYNYWPLRDELRVIAKHRRSHAVISVHDIEVPGTDFGYDTYGEQKLCWDYIAPEIEAIYGPGNYTYRYNQQCTGARRGIVYIYPRQLGIQ
jgi:hypothetical protein